MIGKRSSGLIETNRSKHQTSYHIEMSGISVNNGRLERDRSVGIYPLEASGCNRANVVHKPRLLSDNGSSYISGDLAEWLEDHGIDHLRGAPYHPQTQGKIERWHQTLKNRVLLENYYLPGDLENQISAFVGHYNNQRYHESIGNVTPADAYFGRHTAIIEKRKKIKKLITQNRRLNHQSQAA